MGEQQKEFGNLCKGVEKKKKGIGNISKGVVRERKRHVVRENDGREIWSCTGNATQKSRRLGRTRATQNFGLLISCNKVTNCMKSMRDSQVVEFFGMPED